MITIDTAGQQTDEDKDKVTCPSAKPLKSALHKSRHAMQLISSLTMSPYTLYNALADDVIASLA